MVTLLVRRLAPGAGVALAVAVLGFGVVGLAVADSGADEFPKTFRLAERHGGDKGVHHVVSDYLELGPDARFEFDERFMWSEEQPFLDGRDGTWHAVHARRSDTSYARIYQESYGGPDVSAPMWWIYWVDSATGEAIGDTNFWGFKGINRGPLLGDLNPVLPAESNRAVNTGTRWFDGYECDLETLLRDGVRLDAPFFLPDSCAEPGETPTAYTASPGDVGGVATVKFEATYDGEGWSSREEVHYVAAIPEPVREEWNYFEEGVLVWQYTSVLTGFEHGSGPWHAGIELPQPLTLPAIEVAPRDPWGPSEAGVQHPYPASQAWAEARDDPAFPALRDYLAAHPDAMAASGEYHEEREGNQTHRRWFFLIHADATSTEGEFWLFATQTTGPAGAAATDLLGLPVQTGVPMTTSDHTGVERTQQWDLGPLPTSMSTLASVMARWQVQTGSVAPANGWSFDVERVTAGLAGVDVPTPRAQDLVTGSDRKGSASFLQLAVSHDGTPWGLVQEERTASHGNAGLTGAVPESVPPPSPKDNAGVTVAGMAWTPPTGAVASGAVAVSILAGLVYWLWPLVKGGGLGLFSRIEGPRLLEHPVRRSIMDLIDAQPGIHYQAILRAVGGGKGAIEHHLGKLVAAGMVAKHQGSGYTCFFPANTDHRLVAAAGVLKADGARRVLAAVNAHPGASSIELAAATGLDASTVSHHVHRLADVGLLRATRAGRVLHIEATPLAGAALEAA